MRREEEAARELAKLQMKRVLRTAIYAAALIAIGAGSAFGWNALMLPAILVWIDLFCADTIRLAIREVKKEARR